ncbi:MAG: hypothetical protein KDD42_09075 [Bdellovibrionales bacterium]|nr:hypothetical protein [Bdellovibrionales bacterium]
MRGNRGFRGRGGSSRNGGGRGPGRGGRSGGRSRGGRGSRSGGGRGRHAGGRGRQSSRAPRHGAESGNKRERIAIESGHLVLIDQFMLANPQFIQRLREIMDEDPSAKNDLIKQYGGTVVELSPDRYRIERDPYAFSIVIHPDGSEFEASDISRDASDGQGYVLVDTRCLAMIDRELLDDSSLLEKYSSLWASGQDKACRDLLRDNGGAVRYGFSPVGDELGVFCIPEQDVVALFPDVGEQFEEQLESATEEESA